MVGCSLICMFNALSIGLQYAVPCHLNDLVLVWLVRVMPKGQLPTVKVSVCNIFLSEIDRDCNSIVGPAYSNGVTMELEIKVYISWACAFEPLLT